MIGESRFPSVIRNQTWESLNIHENPKILPRIKCHITVNGETHAYKKF